MWKFIGGLPELKMRVQLAGIRGKWWVRQRSEGNQHVFRSDDGKCLTWSIEEGPSFPRDGTEPSPLEQAIRAADQQIQNRHEQTKHFRRMKLPSVR